MRTEIPSHALTPAIKRLRSFIKNGMRHQSFRDLKKVVRGLRRRRNWLMRNGQWPVKPKPSGDLKGIVGKVYGFKAVNL